MIIEWEESDVKLGRYVMYDPGDSEPKYKISRTYKIGSFLMPSREEYFILIAVTDGATTVFTSKAELADELTKHNYQPVSKSDLVKMIEVNRDQNEGN